MPHGWRKRCATSARSVLAYRISMYVALNLDSFCLLYSQPRLHLIPVQDGCSVSNYIRKTVLRGFPQRPVPHHCRPCPDPRRVSSAMRSNTWFVRAKAGKSSALHVLETNKITGWPTKDEKKKTNSEPSLQVHTPSVVKGTVHGGNREVLKSSVACKSRMTRRQHH